MLTIEQITDLVQQHDTWRRQCMNLIASENAWSSAVHHALQGDLAHRYGNYLGRDVTQRRYTGNRFIQQIEAELETIVRDVFGATEVELRAISGHVAGLAIMMGLCKSGDTVVELSGTDGGHGLAVKAAGSSLIDLNVLPLPFNPDNYNVDIEGTCQLIRERKPRLVFLGSSNFLFPHPVREIAACLPASPDTVIAYDASHVFGLIACGEFQNPLAEGAHVVFGSTHKTLPGPQGGLIIGNNAQLMDAVGNAVYPGIVTNHHLMRSPALAIALLEMKNNPAYARKIVVNARALARCLSERGVPVIAADQDFTQSHTILLAVSKFGTGKDVATLLENADIMTSYSKLPVSLGTECVRVGTSEVTRLGADEVDMQDAADIIADVLSGQVSPVEAQERVHQWAARLDQVQFAEA